MSIYNLAVKRIDQSVKNLSDYKGQVCLIVNTASGCGFTPQYEGLQKLYDEYKEKGFEVLDFPCNQFGNQAPGSDVDLASFCQLKYHTSFETFAKIKVNGSDADPLFKYLKESSPKSKGVGALIPKVIKWNFTKFLVDKDGKVFKRYEPTTTPSEIASDIESLL